MRGGEWIVPVVVLIVWVISTIMKSREEEPARPRKAGAEPGRKPTGEIDKFLQGIDRLRRKSADESRAARPAPPPVVRPVPAVTRVKPASRIEPPAPPPVVVQAAPVVGPAMPSPRADRVVAGRRQLSGATAAFHLLRSPRTLASAVVLQEVLGPPKCRRP
jgi:hypothetical protein